MRGWALVFVGLSACGGGDAPLSPKPPPDLSGVVESFSPTKTPLGRLLGISQGAVPADADLSNQQALSAPAIRRDFLWSRIEPQEGVFDFAVDDAAVDAAAAHGVQTVAILAYNVPWATPTGDDHAPPDPDRYAVFVEKVAEHFRGRVAAYEIWNEPNIGFRFWKPAEDPAAYAEVLARAYPAVKRGDPDAPVLFGGLNWQGVTESGLSFVEDAYFAKPDLGRYYDVMSIHPYPTYPPVRAPESSSGSDVALGLKLAQLRAALAWYGDPGKPIWVTELGWPIYNSVDEPTQARFTVRAAVEVMAAGGDRDFIYTMDDGPNPTAFPPEDAFGLVRNDGTRKPAFGAVSQLVAIDPTATIAADESQGPIRAYRFQGARTFRIFFAPDGMPHPFVPPAGALLDEQGQPIAPAPTTIAGDPIYVVE